jgi:hypothetical protein
MRGFEPAIRGVIDPRGESRSYVPNRIFDGLGSVIAVGAGLRTIAAPTFEVLLVWLCIALVLLGIGYLVRRGLVRGRGSAAREVAMYDVWIGLVALVVYLQLWNLFLALDRVAWIAPIVVGSVGLALIARGLARRGWRPHRPSIGIVAVATALATVWAANQSLATDSYYDDGLYHLSIVRYAATYPAIPGLANLHERLGADEPHLLFAALLSHGPWSGGAVHLVNGFLAALLFVEVGLRFVPSIEQRVPQFTRRVAVLLFLATIVLTELPANPIHGTGEPNQLSSLSIDFPAFIFAAVGLLYLAQSIEDSPAIAPAVTSIAMLSLAAVTRPVFWLTLLLSAGALVLATGRLGGLGTARAFRAMLPAAVLPAGLAVGWAALQAVLTGYPFFPLTVAGLPVDWRVPARVVDSYNQTIASFSRHPFSGLPSDQVLANWHWLSWWIPTESRDLRLIVPLAVVVVSLAALVLQGRVRQSLERRPTAAMLGVVVPCVATLVAWFFLAPDPRFVFAPIWFVPIALAAWTMPAAVFEDFSEPSLTITAVVTIALFLSLEFGNRRLLWAALAVAVAIVLIRYRYGDRAASALARVAAVSVLLATIGFLTSHGPGLSSFVVANQGGTFGAPPVPVPRLVRYRTHSGLILYHPATSPADPRGEQCWSALFCGPFRDLNVRLRGAQFRDGLRYSP